MTASSRISTTRSRRQPWVRGGTNFAGEPFDGALPDPYLGIEPMLELFRRSADAAKAGLN